MLVMARERRGGRPDRGIAEPCGLHGQQPRRPRRGMSSAEAWWGPSRPRGPRPWQQAGASEQASGWGRRPGARLAGLSPPSSPWTLPGEPFGLSSGVWGPEGLRAFSRYWALCPQLSGCLGLAASATQVPPPPAAPCLPGLPPTLWRNFLSLRVAESTELSSQRAAHHPPRPVPCAQPQRVRDDRLTIIKPAGPDFPARQRGPGPSGTKYANHLGPGAQSKGQEIPWVQ